MEIKLSLQGAYSLSITKRLFGLFFLMLAAFGSIADGVDEEINKKIRDIEKKNNVIIGLSAVHIEKNEVISHNSQTPFFMASTIKLPIAVAFLQRVDEKKDSLNRRVVLDTNNSVPGSGTLYHLFEKKRLTISLKQVLNYMMKNSDNSASDTILHEVQGPVYVTKRMLALGFKNIYVNRSILEMLLDTNHISHEYLKDRQPVFSLEKKFNSTPLPIKTMAWERFQNDIRDTTTPDEMARLLVKIHNKEALSAESTSVLLDIMEKCRSGRSRIKGLLPANVKVAHKTGTWAIGEQNYLRYPGSKNLYRFASDVGIITLPQNKGHIALAVYVKSKDASDYRRARSIALISRAIYDHYVPQSVVTHYKAKSIVQKKPQVARKSLVHNRKTVAVRKKPEAHKAVLAQKKPILHKQVSAKKKPIIHKQVSSKKKPIIHKKVISIKKAMPKKKVIAQSN